MNDLALKLKKVRSEYNITVATMAEIASLSLPGYKKNERGLSDPTLGHISLIASFTGVSLDWLAGNSDYPFNKAFLANMERSIFSVDDTGKTAVNLVRPGGKSKLKILPNDLVSIPQNYISDSGSANHIIPDDIRSRVIFLIKSYVRHLITDEYVSYHENQVVIHEHSISNFPELALLRDIFYAIANSSTALDMETKLSEYRIHLDGEYLDEKSALDSLRLTIKLN